MVVVVQLLSHVTLYDPTDCSKPRRWGDGKMGGGG